MLTTKVFFLWLHLGAIVVWVGGLFVMTIVFMPALRAGIDSPGLAARVTAAAAQRFQRISRELIVLILLTGIFNLLFAGLARSFQFSAAYLAMLGAKISLFVILIGLQVWQSTRLYPALATLTAGVERRSDPAPEAVKALQRRALFASALSALLSMVAILLGLQLGFH
jgi:uncharacterized membrane protein